LQQLYSADKLTKCKHENRICGPCRAYERQVADWEANKLQMPKELGNLAKRAKDLQRPYDVWCR
jgi:hypothetical protein